jgi:hypothetical protein
MIPKFVLTLILLLIVSISAFGQVTAEKPSTDSKADQELKAKALLLLAETSQQVRELKNQENQILTRVELADLMWKEQEASARRLYREAFEILRQSSGASDESESESSEQSRTLFRLRTRVVESLGHHDPLMAREFLRQSETSARREVANADGAAADAKPQPERDGEAQRLEMNLTEQIADQNPEEAVRALRSALNQGSSFGTPSLLMKLVEKNPKMAGEVAGELVNKLRTTDFRTNPDAIEMVSFLIAEEATSTNAIVTSGQNKEDGQEEKHPALLDLQTSKEFVEFIVDAALKKNSGEYLLMRLRDMQEELEQIAPAQATRIKQKWAELEKEYPELASSNRFREASRSTDVQEMLEAARAANPETRDSLYTQAAYAAWEQGDKTRPNEIATRNISNAYDRNQLLTTFHERAISDLISNDDLVQARQLIAQTRPTDRRIGQLVDLSAALAEKKDMKTAIEVLNEAQSLIPAKPRNAGELDLQIKLALAFSAKDPDRGFSLLSSAIDQINDLVEATARVANFVSFSVSIRDNEFNMDSHNSIPGLSALLSRDLIKLAASDFAGTRSLFAKFQRPEIRVAAYLGLSSAILEPAGDCTCTCPNPAKKQNKPVEK